jgi:prephenate dehydrogenase
MPQLFKQMTLCGVGLIGGSLALVAQREKLVGRIVGLGRSQANLDVARQRNMVDVATRDPVEAAKGADLIVLAVPIMTMRGALAKMVPHCAPDAVVTDVGSVKQWVVRELEPLLRDHMSLVAAHPVAGKETTGAASADPALFVGRRVIITPSARSTPIALERVEALWRATGARVEQMPPDLHDQILARASHLPQAVATVLAAALNEERIGGKLAAQYGAGGLRDMTRLAASSWEMWRDIFASNRDAIVGALKLYRSTFVEFEQMVERGDTAGLEQVFNRGREMKERVG